MIRGGAIPRWTEVTRGAFSNVSCLQGGEGGRRAMEEENHVWRSELEEAGHRLVAEGASLVLEERVEDALVAFDGGLELAPALRPYTVSEVINNAPNDPVSALITLWRLAEGGRGARGESSFPRCAMFTLSRAP